ncbi:MAG: hypothetical protein J6L75_01535 [Alistipes sp.]|nr:hypothetical protein [Alistipes sp.]
MRKFMMLVASCAALLGSIAVEAQQKSVELSHVDARLKGGCPVANFAFTFQVGEDGVPGYLWRNTGRLGGWLEAAGRMDIKIAYDGKEYTIDEFENREVTRRFPFASVVAQRKGIKSQLTLETFAPLGVNDEHTSSLPALMMEFGLKNPTSRSEEFSIIITPCFDGEEWASDGDNKLKGTTLYLGCNTSAQWDGKRLSIPVKATKSAEQRVRLLLTSYDKEWISARSFASAEELYNYGMRNWDILRERTQQFAAAIPQTSDDELNAYLRWYMTAGISLTRLTADGKALTLGYCELNQRDSFWTSWLHLVLFRKLDWQMIEQSYKHISSEGKVPTCIYPVIERKDDLDINLFLLLRTARHYAFYNNTEQVRGEWASMQRVMDWVISRDFDGEGLPQQISFWGDWKDVNYVADRKYSPFVAMLYLAALEQMEYFANLFDDKAAAARYAEAYAKGYAKLNRPTSEGGLWNGRYYCQIWKDGSVKELLYQDQIVGVMYGVVPSERATSIIEELNKSNSSPYGIANSYPFLPEVRDPEAEYHNGGVWPWVCFMDAWARMRQGRTQEGISLIKKVAMADLVRSGDYVPNEHLNSLTGENLGFPIQGWNAALFGTVYFNLTHPEARFKIEK